VLKSTCESTLLQRSAWTRQIATAHNESASTLRGCHVMWLYSCMCCGEEYMRVNSSSAVCMYTSSSRC
jgi:hypothetical protein